MRIQDFHWALWASNAAQMEKYARTGFKGQSTFYTPSRRGDIDQELNEQVDAPTPEDLALSEQIGKGVRAYLEYDQTAAKQLILWFGAFPGAPERRNQRVAAMGVNPNRAYELVKAHKAWVEGWVAMYRQIHFAA